MKITISDIVKQSVKNYKKAEKENDWDKVDKIAKDLTYEFATFLDEAEYDEKIAKELAKVLLDNKNPQYVSDAMSDSDLNLYVKYVLPQYEKMLKDKKKSPKDKKKEKKDKLKKEIKKYKKEMIKLQKKVEKLEKQLKNL